VTRLALLAGAVLALGPAAARAATNEYSTGSIDARIGGRLDRSLTVPDRGPVSFVRVSFRISVPNTAALAISLVGPRGTRVPLVVHRGDGADFGTGDRGCGGIPTVFDSDLTISPISAGTAPFTDDPYRAEGRLPSLYGEEAHGRWTLHVENSGPPARLHCFTLDISRSVPQRLTARSGAVRATVTYTERDSSFERLRLRVVRAGRTVVDAPLERLGCSDCAGYRPSAVRIRDLDGGEPEVLVDLYTGGAHCCATLLVLRYDPASGTYRPRLFGFGNYGYRLVDIDGDGLPELSASDERFLYTFTAYVFSAAPPRIVRYRRGDLVDVTRRFPQVIERSAAELARSFLHRKRPPKDVDLRAYVAAYVADRYLLGRPAEARRALAGALAHGLLYSGRTYLGTPAGKRFVTVLMRDLREWGYVRPGR
jgi:subtilisin-like proprotein convertase family protein